MRDSDPRILHTGEGRVLLGLTKNELQALLDGRLSQETKDRLTKALGLLDFEEAMRRHRES